MKLHVFALMVATVALILNLAFLILAMNNAGLFR